MPHSSFRLPGAAISSTLAACALYSSAMETNYPGGLMSTFLGNLDVGRFLTAAHEGNGDVCPDGELRQAGAPEDGLAFDKLRLAWTLLFTQPGMPLVYYGDEFGLPGYGDPDNRQPFGDPSSTAEFRLQTTNLAAGSSSPGKDLRVAPGSGGTGQETGRLFLGDSGSSPVQMQNEHIERGSRFDPRQHRVPYLVEAFNITKYDAQRHLVKWMETFGERHSQAEEYLRDSLKNRVKKS